MIEERRHGFGCARIAATAVDPGRRAKIAGDRMAALAPNLARFLRIEPVPLAAPPGRVNPVHQCAAPSRRNCA
ncbi:hypothetical protein [Thermomonas sp. XSG]|uniref:hypothetical protein n=1 Tax=Thermomonas sp. XSG TaxID=2771436 RepID=UPI0016813601|nr:hypothetical protein [Thermomonas sp. XSG]QNU15955.1 hypothetical protein ICG51_002378 [Thermomonas sp. XSG]